MKRNRETLQKLTEILGKIRILKVLITGKSLSEAFLIALHVENMLCTKIVPNVRNNFCTQHVPPGLSFEFSCIELAIQ